MLPLVSLLISLCFTWGILVLLISGFREVREDEALRIEEHSP